MDTTRPLGDQPDAIAPDTMEVRLLATGWSGSMAHFRLPAGAVGRAVMHDELEELWYCTAGQGEMWLSTTGDRHEPPMPVRAGVSFVIPRHVCFQLRNTGDGPVDFVAVTMPPWPGDHAARLVAGPFD